MKRPAFELGTGGCQCASCKVTSDYIGKGFAAWPRGNPAGRKSGSDYAAHVARSRFDARKGEVTGFTLPGLVYPVQQAPKGLLDWINRKAPDQAEARPASPAEPCKAPQHFPELDRQPRTAVIYAMPKSEPKKPVGRPPIGRRVVVNLEEEHIKRARKMGGGNLSAGIRKALAKIAQSG
jgi:hypothetical protein